MRSLFFCFFHPPSIYEKKNKKVGGFSGLMGAVMLGPRFRRYADEEDERATKSQFAATLKHQFEFGHNVPFQVLGAFILWFGWYGFNAGSTLAANGAMELASKVAVTTTLSCENSLFFLLHPSRKMIVWRRLREAPLALFWGEL